MVSVLARLFSLASGRRSFWTVMLCGAVLIAALHSVQILKWRSSYDPVMNHTYFNYNLDQEEPVDPEQTCLIPRIHPFDPSVLKYLETPKFIYCKSRQELLTYVDDDCVLRYNATAMKQSGYELRSLSCVYQIIHRENGSDSSVVFDSNAKPIPAEGVLLESDFVSVVCYNFVHIKMYQNIHAHVCKKSLKHISLPPPAAFTNHPQKYSVLIFGLDSISRLSFIRDLPKTYKYLQDVMGALVFRGMTKIGDNTFPNLVAMLTGESVTDGRLPVVNSSSHYDNWPLIWNMFSKNGYVTMYAEDRPDIATFNYLRKGFLNQPTDHYFRPFWLAVEQSMLHRLSSPLCFGGVPKHLLQMKYVRDFVIKYSEHPFFAFSFLVELNHDYSSRIRQVDDDLTSWLNDLFQSDMFRKTVVIVMSDHGHRFNAVRSTLVGRIEERMPIFAIYVPPSLKWDQPRAFRALKSNVGRLTSPYDVFHTLVDVLSYSTFHKPLGSAIDISSRGRTLFAPILPNRTCDMAGIPDHYCTCEQEIPAKMDDVRVIRAANALMDVLNELVSLANRNSSLCAPMRLLHIKRADMVVSSHKVIINSRIYFGKLVEDSSPEGMFSKFKLIVVVEPSGGTFEATILHRKDEDTFSVLGDISRISEYGNQSWCINDPVLRKYCYCHTHLSGEV